MPIPRTTRRALTARLAAPGLAALSLVALLAGTACGSTAPDRQPSVAAADEAPAAAPGRGDLPAISVIDVTTGASVLLTDLAADPRPTLLWMWAPH